MIGILILILILALLTGSVNDAIEFVIGLGFIILIGGMIFLFGVALFYG